ncbi:VOC family protein [Streptomyces sp. NPDC001507]|uniref:VOC family protein n=1 Tax=Streptomyces sp. NPDC001507 TaxID=3364579 RepID=UPI0036B53B71
MLTTTYVPGAPNWLDLGTPDPDASAAFYAAVFGWQHRSAGPEAGGYGFFQQDGGTVAGIGPLTGESAGASWRVYFHTPDADATAKAVEQAGGSVRIAPSDVFAFGRAAAFVDPAGADFAVWQPGETAGLDLVAVPGSLARTELYTTDANTAKAFYGAVFSWQTRDVPMGPGLTYTILTPAGAGPAAAHGGLMQLPQANLDAGSTPEWHPYFEVSDCDATFATATDSGATALMPVTEAPGIGRFAMLLDPLGAFFAIITTARG